MNTDWEKADFLCFEYCCKLSECNHEGAKTVADDLDQLFSTMPMQEIPFILKKRFELHEILKRVLEATTDLIMSDALQLQTFSQLSDMFKTFCGKFNDPVVEDIKTSENLFEYYKELIRFQVIKQLSPPLKTNNFVNLDKEDFSYYMELICEVISCFEPAVLKKYSFIEKSFCKEDLIALLQVYPYFFSDIFKQFISVFCFGLKFFHAMCGLPNGFKIPDILNRQLNFDEHVGTSTSYRLKNKYPTQKNSGKSSLIDSENHENKSPLKQKSLRDILNSKSPPKEFEIVKADGELWENSSCGDVSMSVASNTPSSSHRKKKWTKEETTNLIRAVKQYGVGKWQYIRCDKKYLLSQKTNIQLKDKWRIITKHDPSMQDF